MIIGKLEIQIQKKQEDHKLEASLSKFSQSLSQTQNLKRDVGMLQVVSTCLANIKPWVKSTVPFKRKKKGQFMTKLKYR
jgi:hypothetical protein